jgi:hypothetical protein
MTNPMPGLETANETVIRSWESILIDLGCEKALLH